MMNYTQIEKAIIANAKGITKLIASWQEEEKVSRIGFTKNDILWIYYNYQHWKENKQLINKWPIESLQDFTRYCNNKFKQAKSETTYCKYGNHGLALLPTLKIPEGEEHVYTYPTK